MDIPVKEGFSRRPEKRRDRFEQEDIAFHQRIREGYLSLADEDPQRWLVIDATLSKAGIKNIIWERVSQLLIDKGYMK